MLLTSSLEPDGPKSTQHYIVIHNNGLRNLVKLPKTYRNLEEKVKKLYHIERGDFYLETMDLNICKGERVRIEEEDWDDIAQLLGNVHIVTIQAPVDSHPESSLDIQSDTTMGFTTDQRVLELTSPFVKDECLVIDIGHIEFEVGSTSKTEFKVQILDVNKTAVITISIVPRAGRLFFASSGNDTTATLPLRKLFPLDSGHSLLLHKIGDNFKLFCDFEQVASVQAPTSTHSPLTAVRYNLGVQSPFEGPISAEVHASLKGFFEGSKVYYSSTYVVMAEKETLYQQILSCNPVDANHVLQALESIRKENVSSQHSSSAIRWKGFRANLNVWEDLGWSLKSHSLLVVRFVIPQGTKLDIMYVHFGPPEPMSLRVTMTAGHVLFAEYDESNTASAISQLALPFPWCHPDLTP